MEKHYLSELPEKEIRELILYPSELYGRLYEYAAEDNSEWCWEMSKEILGRDFEKWVEIDSTSYDWWMSIMPGRYKEVLNIKYDYFSENTAERVKELQDKVRELAEKVENLEDCYDYYDKIGEWEDEADEIAGEILKIVEERIKEDEKVNDDQIVDMFIGNDMGAQYYYIGDNKNVIYEDLVRSWKTNQSNN